MQLTMKQPEAKETCGLEDGGHVYIRCSNCEAFLMDLWRTMPRAGEDDKPMKWKLRASCPWCGDKSYVTEVEGVFHRGGYGKVKEDDPNDTWPSTVVDGSPECVDGIFHFNIIKENESAKPYYG